MQPRQRLLRKGMASVETLMIFATFVVASFVFFLLGKRVIIAFFGDGNHYLAIPLF
jgi:hypothetical protein